VTLTNSLSESGGQYFDLFPGVVLDHTSAGTQGPVDRREAAAGNHCHLYIPAPMDRGQQKRILQAEPNRTCRSRWVCLVALIVTVSPPATRHYKNTDQPGTYELETGPGDYRATGASAYYHAERVTYSGILVHSGLESTKIQSSKFEAQASSD